MGDHADDAIFAGLDQSWGWRRTPRYSSRPAQPKNKNQIIFAKFARDGIKFKTNDRVVHIASGSAGVVLSSRGDQVCWKPDSRINPGGIWVDSETLRYDI